MGILFTALSTQSTYDDGDYVLSYDVSAGGARRTYFSGLYSYICTKLATGSASPIRAADGTAAAPGLGFTSDLDTGFYRPAADQLGLALGGATILSFSATVLVPTGSVNLGTSSYPFSTIYSSKSLHGDGIVSAVSIGFTSEANTGLYRAAASDLRFALGGADSLRLMADGVVLTGSLKATTGDPTGIEGLVTINTNDNVAKLYADGAWRTLASW